jgi:hypothetical protein
MEIWKPVIGLEGLYEISNLANVRRVARGKRLDSEKIPMVKQMFKEGALLREVAEFLGTSIATASMIKNGRTWQGDASFRPVKTKVGSDHYVYFSPCKDGKYSHRPVHRCLWEAFNGPIQGRLEINHKNLDRSDNRLDNLELITHRQNFQHAIDAYKSRGLLRAVKGTKGFIAGKHSTYPAKMIQRKC